MCSISAAGASLGFYAKPLISSLVANLGHQHGKVRSQALQAIGVVIQQEHAHGLFEEIAPVLKTICQYDRTSAVRKCLYEVVATWLKHLPIAYLKTYEARLLYMLLGGLGDPDTKESIPFYLEECGQRRQLISRDLNEALPPEQEDCSPDEFLVLKHLNALMNLCIADLQEWSVHEHFKVRASIVLAEILNRARRHITPLLDQLFKALLKAYSQAEKPELLESLRVSVKSLGLYCDLSLIVDLTLRNTLTDTVSTSQKAGGLDLFSHVLQCHSRESIGPHINQVLRLISQKDFCLSDQLPVLQSLISVIEAFTLAAESLCIPLTHTLFNVLLVLQNSAVGIKTHPILEMLANISDVSVADIYAQELPILLPVITQDYLTWGAESPNRHSFKALTMQAGYAVTHCWDQIMGVLLSCSEPDKDVQVKLDALIILEHFLQLSELADFLRAYSQRILSVSCKQGIIIPTATWRAGRSQVEVRKGSMINLHKLFGRSLLLPEVVVSEWPVFLPVIKTCLSDDYDWTLRFQSCSTVNRLLKSYAEVLEPIQFSDIYPELMARLDDAQDTVRIKSCRGLEAFFIALRRIPSFSNYRYMVDTLFIQLDDPSESIQAAVSRALTQAIPYKPAEFIVSAEAAMNRHRHPRAVNELLSLAKMA